MSLNNTPGPYSVDFTVSEDGPCICGPDGLVFAQVYGPHRRARADAILLASSHNLLKALKEIAFVAPVRHSTILDAAIRRALLVIKEAEES